MNTTWTKLRVLQAIEHHSRSIYAIGGGLVVTTAFTMSLIAALFLLAAFGAAHIVFWNEYDRATTKAYIESLYPQKALMNTDTYGRHARN